MFMFLSTFSSDKDQLSRVRLQTTLPQMHKLEAPIWLSGLFPGVRVHMFLPAHQETKSCLQGAMLLDFRKTSCCMDLIKLSIKELNKTSTFGWRNSDSTQSCLYNVLICHFVELLYHQFQIF